MQCMPVATKVVCHGVQGMTGCISVCCKVCSFATVHESVNFEEQVVSKVSKVNALT